MFCKSAGASMSGAGNLRGPEEMSDQVFAQVLLTLNEVAICFADMPPKVSEDLHHVLGESSDGETYETELPIAGIRSSRQSSGSKMQEYGDLGIRYMESEQPGCSELLTKHSNRHLRDHCEDAGPESAQDKCHTVEHQCYARTEIEPNNRHNVEHQYCAEPDVQPHTRHHNTEHQYCAEPENQFSNRHHEMEHHYCSDLVVHHSNLHINCTESKNQSSSIHTDLSQNHFVDPECEPIKRHLAVEHQYCAEPANEPKHQEAQHHDCVDVRTVPIQKEAEHHCSAEPDNAAVHQEAEECCSKEEIALRHQEMEHRYYTEIDNELENDQASCEVEYQYCGQLETEPNDNHELIENQQDLQDESNKAYFVMEHKEYSEHAAVETASQESADPELEQYIGQIQTNLEDHAEPQCEHPKICMREGSDNYFEHSNEYVHVQHNPDLVCSTNPNNGIVEDVCEDYTEPELMSECLIVSFKEEAEDDSGSNCIETGERLDVEPETVHSDRCIAVYHDAYAIVEVGPMNGTVGILHENIKQDFHPSDEYMGSNCAKYDESSYVPISRYCEDPDGETSNPCLVVYHGQYVEQVTEPSRQSSEGDHEEYTLQLELLEAASEVTKEQILKLPKEEELCMETQLQQASYSVDGPDMHTKYEQGLIQCTNPSVLWSATTASKAHTCAECGKAFSRNSNLIVHRRTHTGEKPFKCAECAKSFVSSSKLIAHERTHTEPSPTNNYKKDLEACAEKVRTNQSPRIDKADSPQCTEQGKTSMWKKKMGRKQRSIVCLEHASDVETDVNKSNSRKKPGRKKGVKKIHICIECGRNFSRLSNLVNHQRTHTGEKPYECSECGKRFSDVANMITHGRVHTGEKPFACGRCGKSFSRLSNMKTHQRMHTGEKPYPCSQCDKRFSHSSHLVTHQQLHTGERPHTCEECGKSFSRLANMLTHQKLHKGEKPYLCNVCFKRFNRSSHLTKHLQMHMREDLLMREDALRMEQQMCIREHIIILQ